MPPQVMRRSQRAAAEAAAAERQKMLGLDSPLLAGLHLPSSLHNHKAVATILTHTTGHTPLADLRSAIAFKRQQTADQATTQAAQLTLHPHTDTGHALDHSLDPNKSLHWPSATTDAMRAALFGQQVSELKQHETLLAINPSLSRLGQAVMTEEERAELEETRESEWEAGRAEERRRDRERLQVEWSANQPALFMADVQPSHVPTFQMEDVAEADERAAVRKEQLISSFVSGVSKLVVRQRVEARVEAATRQLKGGASQSTALSSFFSRPLLPEDDAFLAQLDAHLQPPSSASAAADRFDASELLLWRSGESSVGAAVVPALFEPVVLHEHSAGSEELVRQLLTPPPAVVELAPAAVPAAEVKGAKGKSMAAAKDAKASMSAKGT